MAQLIKALGLLKQFADFSALWRSRHTKTQLYGNTGATAIAFVVWYVLTNSGVDNEQALVTAGVVVTLVSPLLSRALAKLTFASSADTDTLYALWLKYESVPQEQYSTLSDEAKAELCRVWFWLGSMLGAKDVWQNDGKLYNYKQATWHLGRYGVNLAGEMVDLISGKVIGPYKASPSQREQIAKHKKQLGLL